MFKRAKKGARGKAQENMVMNPNWMTISRYSLMIMAVQVGARKKSWRYWTHQSQSPDVKSRPVLLPGGAGPWVTTFLIL